MLFYNNGEDQAWLARSGARPGARLDQGRERLLVNISFSNQSYIFRISVKLLSRVSHHGSAKPLKQHHGSLRQIE